MYENEFVVKSNKSKLVLGIGCLCVLLVFGVMVYIEKEPNFTGYYAVMIAPLFVVCAVCNFLIYYRKRIYVKEEGIVVLPVLGTKKEVAYGDIKKIVFNHKNVNIRIYRDKRKIVTVHWGMMGYLELEQLLREKCGDRIKEIGR